MLDAWGAGFVQNGAEAAEAEGQGRHQIEAERVGAVGEGAFGRFVDFEEDAVGAGGDGGRGERLDELGRAAAGRAGS